MAGAFRVYTSSDVKGTELAAALKNVIAIAAGISDGLGFGDNAKAALITRGLAEMSRLGVALGARRETFAGLTGLGDLITTCISPYGRNLKVGRAIGAGRSLEDILQEMGQVVPEGVWTTKSTLALAEREEVEMPITREVYRVLFEGKSPHKAVEELMMREPKPETDIAP
jgi:glycerol-3-phosphate dehydrogenase (NAD(P)+)